MPLPREMNVRLASAVLVVILSLSVPVSADEYEEAITVREIAKTTVTADGQPVRYPRTENPEVTARFISVPPGAETGWHRHPVPVYGYVISGTLEVKMKDGKVITYHQGDAIIEMVNSLHNATNRGDAPVELVAFYTGEKGTADTVTAPEND